MAVYGHELINLDFSKGLWLTDTPDNVPEGYCYELTNLEIDDNGAAIVRKNFIPTFLVTGSITDSTMGYTATTSPPPEYFCDVYTKAFSFSPVGTDDPIILLQHKRNATDASINWLKKNGVTATVDSSKLASQLAKDMTQYRDRYYALNIAGTNVSRWSFSGSTVTITSVATIPACHTLITFRDRLFAFAESRVYYTELATAGTAENWNSGNNFFDMPSIGAKIVAAIPHNDRIFIFTTEGAYQVYCLGNPSTWSVSLITTTVRVYSKNAVALIRDVFVYTDTTDIYTFNGNYPQAIGEAVKDALKESFVDGTTLLPGPTGFRILPYDQGFILSLTYAQASVGEWKESPIPRHYYFNGKTWSKIEPASANEFLHRAIIATFKTKAVGATSTEAIRPTDVIVELRQNQISPKTYTMRALSVRASNIDYPATGEQPVQLWFETRTIQPRKQAPGYSRLFSILASIKSTGNIQSALIAANENDTEDSVGDLVVLTNGNLNTRIVRFGVGILDRAESFRFRLYTALTKTEIDGEYPSHRINNISAEINSDTAIVPERAIRK